MATAKQLKIGTEAHVIAGHYEGHTARIVDNVPIPDGGDHRAEARHQRKVLVSIEGDYVWMLPRLLDPNHNALALSVDHAEMLAAAQETLDAASKAIAAMHTMVEAMKAQFEALS